MAFYYDDQMNNDTYTVRLYGDGSSTGANSEAVYGDKVLAKALFTENFEFEIGNSWTNFDAGNMIEGLFNSIKPLAAYIGSPDIQNIFRNMKQKGYFDNTDTTSGPSRLLNAFGSYLGDPNNKINDYLNKSLVVQGTRFIYFSGTNVDMGNLVMKYTVLHDPVNNRTVQNQLYPLLPYVIGNYSSMSKGGLLSMIGWQDPPGGYRADYKNVDTVNTGTLKLVFGDMFYIDNLVCKSANFVFSRSKVKVDDPLDKGTPLYADVTLSFQLAGFITRNKLQKYANIRN